MFNTSPKLFRLVSAVFAERRHVRITEILTGKVVAEVPQLSPAVTVEPDDKAFIFHGGTTVTRVDLPPKTDYGWLVRYGVLPPAVLVGLWEVWRRRRRAVARRKESTAAAQSA